MATIGKTNPLARTLRRDSTDAEHRLWRHLPNRRLGAFKFRRQVTIGQFVADFACLECRVVVEADGGQHGSEEDASRTALLEDLGWKMVRFWNDDILLRTDAVLTVIHDACVDRKKEEPSPCPLPHTGEGK